ncbi:MAG: GGDEF domain-containing protein [Lachnospiraceae bacterium]|nr:GGDEF domain-containing protein [Lachnospiraceae bacterium]
MELYRYQEIYVEINVICIVMLLAIWRQIRKDVDQSSSRQMFRIMIFMIIAIQVLDTVWVFIDHVPELAFWNYMINATYMSLTGAIGMAWWIYVAYRLGEHERIQKYMFLIIIPLSILIICAYSSYYTGWIFTIDENGEYARGELHFIQQTMALVYYICPLADLHYHLFKRNYTQQQKEELYTMLSFFILPAIGLALNILLPSLPSIWPAATFSAAMIYTSSLKQATSMDELTGLHNRNDFQRRLSARFSENDTENLYMFLMDLNSFKKINDTYGHISGDRALQDTANMMREAVAGKDLYLARYGGDEFAILGKFASEEDAEEMKRVVKETAVMHQLLNRRPYKISISVGYAAYHEGFTMQQLIDEADRMLYQDKANFHNKG